MKNQVCCIQDLVFFRSDVTELQVYPLLLTINLVVLHIITINQAVDNHC